MTTNNQQVEELRDEIDDFIWHIENDSREYHENAKSNLKSAIDFYITQQLTLKDEQHAKELELAKIEAKIEELKNSIQKYGRTYRQTVINDNGDVYVDDSHRYISNYEIQERLSELNKQKELLNEQ